MANKNLFSTRREDRVQKTDTKNKAGGRAYKMSDEEALCQFAVTSTFNDAYYASGKSQLDEVKSICENVRPELIAKAAVYGQERGGMKDIPAYLLAVLLARGEKDLLERAFPRVIKSPKMLLNFVQMVRSNVTGRKSFGSLGKRLIQNWITSRRGNSLFLASSGYSDPSLTDVIKMVHPRPVTSEQDALFAYLVGKDHNYDDLPPLLKEFDAFKEDNTNPLPDMDFRSLTNCNLTKDHWKGIALNMPWNTLRMNLNNLNRHGVFEDSEVVERVANKLRNRQEIERNNVFPYQLMTTFMNVADELPRKVTLALQDALEIATENVPVLGDRVAVCVDVSGSMHRPVTGHRAGGVSTKTFCVDVGALIGTSIARTNPEATLITFGTSARVMPGFNPRDSLMTNCTNVRNEGRVLGFGTNISAAMKIINESKKPYDFVIFVGDSQSWRDDYMTQTTSRVSFRSLGYGGTELSKDWARFKGRNKRAKLAEIVLGPYSDTQMPTSDPSVMNIGGFSDSVFDVLNEFAHRDGNQTFSKVVGEVEL